VTAGIVQISGENWKKNYVVGDYFGEMSLVTGSRTSAHVTAKTDVELVSFSKEDFLSILRGNTETIDFILNLSERRSEPSWQIISANSVLHRVTNAQKTRLQAVMKKREVVKGEEIWKFGDSVEFVYIVGEGLVKFANKPDLTEPFKMGAFLGEINAILSGNGTFSTVLVAETSKKKVRIENIDFV
jgi:CRP-like cAMP-binding protein